MTHPAPLLIANATLLTMDVDDRIHENADLLIVEGRIEAIGEHLESSLEPNRALRRIDGRGMVVLPGFVQTHLHLCQTLFRNLADDLELIDWLRQRIWPFEGAHTFGSLQASADLALVELIRSGTTCFLDMGTVHHTDAVGEAVRAAGVRAFIGKTMMDSGDDIPRTLKETTRSSLRESEALKERWHGAAKGLIHYALCPRFAHSCSGELLKEVGAMSRDWNVVIHTHSSETQFEVSETQRLYGTRNIPYLHRCDMTGPRSVFAHGVWLDDAERTLLRDSGTAIAHCPSSNLKLASGLANIPLLWKFGVKVGLGCDGAPCNNTLDMFTEMRHAALVQKPTHGPTAMPAQRVLRMATIDGARCLGLEDEIGSLEVGKRADVIGLRLDRAFNGVGGTWASRIVYASYPENVDTVVVDGRVLMEKGALLNGLDEERVVARATEELDALLGRVELA